MTAFAAMAVSVATTPNIAAAPNPDDGAAFACGAAGGSAGVIVISGSSTGSALGAGGDAAGGSGTGGGDGGGEMSFAEPGITIDLPYFERSGGSGGASIGSRMPAPA